ncbi:integral membrane protein [Nannizzia gypsea CBS 118893]|uniref:Integral membrane protein n=1 Tax=Arthroderma gypseum (strain ATCC MYA-4604 / CBS 118893) TaxID=535722 RepID=E4UVU7_ARTGP|nr:integral membrane protein [Nannizzia gypsea CBS 118893]EFR02424.1 integral membrane protein [Nannizzia gypsea CBS 118893]
MQLPPASVILSWPRPNYENPTDVRGPLVIIMNSIFASLTLLVIMIRIFSRIHVSRSFGWDDIFIIAAVIPTFGCGTITILGSVKYGWSRHVYDVPFKHLVIGLKLTMLIECLFAISCSFTKLSLLCFTHKITSGIKSRTLRWLIIANATIVTLEMFVFVIVAVFTCRPVSAYWTLSTKPQDCINETAHLLAGGILNTLTDISVVFLPLPTVMSLKLPTRQRVMLCILFSAGFIVCIAGCFRAYFLHKLNTSYDKTWVGYPLWIAGTIEMYLGVIAASLASLKPFFVRYFPWLLGSLTSKKTGPSSFSFLNSYILRRSAPQPAPETKGKPVIFDSLTDTLTSTMHGTDVELGEIEPAPRTAGTEEEAPKLLGHHEAGHLSKSTFHSADATSQSELRRK